MACTRKFWIVVAVGAVVAGFLLAAMVAITNFNTMRMRDCYHASNISVYLMFNIFMFFNFSGMLALGEALNHFDSRKRSIPHRHNLLIAAFTITVALGSAGLAMLKSAC